MGLHPNSFLNVKAQSLAMESNEEYLDLKKLSNRVSLSVRTLRDYLKDSYHPLPHYKLAGKILIFWPDFKEWIVRYRTEGEIDIDSIVSSVLE